MIMVVKEQWCLNTAIRYTLGVTAMTIEAEQDVLSEKLKKFSSRLKDISFSFIGTKPSRDCKNYNTYLNA